MIQQEEKPEENLGRVPALLRFHALRSWRLSATGEFIPFGLNFLSFYGARKDTCVCVRVNVIAKAKLLYCALSEKERPSQATGEGEERERERERERRK